jgi:probable HAF family extracellular repeat protein
MTNHRRYHGLALAFLSLAALTNLGAYGQKNGPAYTFTDLGALSGLSFKESAALGINDAGQIVGTSYTMGTSGPVEVAVVWQKDAAGRYAITNLVGSLRSSSASAINSQGDIVAGGSLIRPILLNGSMVWYEDLNNVGVNDLALDLRFGASAISDNMQMVGGADLLQFDASGGEIVSALPGDGYAINNNRQVAGEAEGQAIVWQVDAAGNVSSTVTLLPLAGNTGSSAFCIDTLGRAAGYSYHPVSSFAILERATLWQNGVAPTDLGAPANSGSAALGVNTVNKVLQVVGYVDNHNGDRAFIWKNGKMVDLNTLISASGVLLSKANAINANGQIVGLARVTVGKQNVEIHAFLLTPN